MPAYVQPALVTLVATGMRVGEYLARTQVDLRRIHIRSRYTVRKLKALGWWLAEAPERRPSIGP